MADFFRAQMDYIYFFYGLAFIILSAVCFIISKDERQRLQWIWLGLFGLAHGIYEWLNILAINFWDSRSLKTLGVLLAVASFVFLAEFGRSGIVVLRGKGPGRWVFLPLLSFTALGGFAGLNGILAVSRYTICFVGGLWATRALFLASGGLVKSARRWLLAGSFAVGIYTLLAGIFVPSAPFPPASFLNTEVFFQVFGFPLQLIRGVIAVLAAISIWVYSQTPSGETEFNDTSRRRTFLPIIILVGIVVIGWIFTQFTGNHARDEQIKEDKFYLSALSDRITYKIEHVKQIAHERANSSDITAPFATGRHRGRNPGDFAHLRCIPKSYHSYSFYMFGRQNKTVFSCADKNGSKITVKSGVFLKETLSGKGGGFFAFDSLSDEWNYYAYAPLRDMKGNITGAVLVKENFGDIETGFRKRPHCFLIDPNGVVFLSSDEKMCLKALWPLKEDARKKISVSGQPGGGPFIPLMPDEPMDGKYVTFEGQQLLVTRQPVGQDGWSLVFLDSTSHIRAYRLFTIFTTFVFCGMTIFFFAAIYFTRKSSAEIAISERRYRSLVEGSPNCVVLFDRQGRCLKINMTGLNLIGWTEQDVVGKKLDELWLGEACCNVNEIISSVLGGEKCSFEAESIRPDGKTVIWNVILNPFYDSDGQIRNFVGIFTDVTEKKILEAEHEHAHREVVNQKKELEIMMGELTKHRDNLDVLVKERTEDLSVANQRLHLEITERKQAEEAITEMNARLQTLLQAMPDMVFFKDVKGKHLLVNKAVEEFTGHREDELLGRTNDELLPRDLAEYCNKSDESVVKSGVSLHFEERLINKKGEVRFFDTVKSPIYSSEGNILGMVGVSRDITERKVAEEALKENEKTLRTITDTAKDAIVMMDEKGNISFWNPAAEKIFGYTKEEALGRELHSFLGHKKHYESYEKGFNVFKETGKGSVIGKTLELEAIRKDGTEFPIELSLSAIQIKGIWFATGIIRDITARKRAEENLKLFSDVIEEAIDGVQIVDLTGHIVYSNNAVSEIYGLAVDEMMGKNVNELNADKEFADRVIIPAIKEVGRWSGELMVNHKDGHIFPIWLSASLVKDHKGNPMAMVGIIRDITERKQVEEELKRHRENLEDLVEERTTELKMANEQLQMEMTERKKLEEQLYHAQKIEAVGQLAGGIAHDFNNILTAIIGNANILQMKIDAESPLNKYMNRIVSSAERASNLTKSLLTFSRKREITPMPVKVNSMLTGVEKILQSIIGEDIKLEVVIIDKELVVMADSGQIEQVLINLATNARDAMADKGGFLTIKSDSIELDENIIKAFGYGEPGMYAHISLTDTGMGMDGETRKRIFEPFFTTKEVGKGTGLGLAIVYGIIKQHNGFIDFQSEPGKGTSFDVYLPLTSAKVVKSEAREHSNPEGGTETILLAEDDTDVRKIIKYALEDCGYTVIEAGDGEEAINKFMGNKDKIHFLLSDIIMPKLNGKEVYEMVKKIKPDIKVLFISGYASDIIHKKVSLDQGLNLMVKPVLMPELLKKVRKILDA